MPRPSIMRDGVSIWGRKKALVRECPCCPCGGNASLKLALAAYNR